MSAGDSSTAIPRSAAWRTSPQPARALRTTSHPNRREEATRGGSTRKAGAAEAAPAWARRGAESLFRLLLHLERATQGPGAQAAVGAAIGLNA